MNSTVLLRQEKARSMLVENGIDAFVLSKGDNIQYFTGVTEPSIHACGAVILHKDELKPYLAVLWLDKEAVKDRTDEFEILKYVDNKTQVGVIKSTLRKLGVKKCMVGIDYLTQKEVGAPLKVAMPDIEFLDIAEQIASITCIKTEEEVELIKRACEMSDEGMKAAMESLKPGISEVEIAYAAESEMIRLGSDRLKHNSIVASGLRSKLIHPWATQKKIEPGELITIDIGAVCDGYCSDIARTAFLGKPPKELIDTFNLFARLEDKVMENLKPGVYLSQIKTIINGVLDGTGYKLIGPIGHNVGLHVEERPFLIPKVGYDFTIEKNMVISIFSGSLQKNKSVGIRLEDTVWVTDKGPELFTNFSRDFFY